MSLRLLDTATQAWLELAGLQGQAQGAKVTVDGQSLTISQLVAIAR